MSDPRSALPALGPPREHLTRTPIGPPQEQLTPKAGRKPAPPPAVNFIRLRRGDQLVLADGLEHAVGVVATVTRIEWRGTEPLVQVREVGSPFGPYWARTETILRMAGP